MQTCAICQGAHRAALMICSECADPHAVKTYCRRCQTRLTLAPADVEQLMALMGVTRGIQPGTVIVFLFRCPVCRQSGEQSEYPQRLFAIDS